MNDETLNERRARENAARIAAHQRATARTPVPTREDVIGPSRDLLARRKTEEAQRIDAHERATARDMWVRMHPGQAVPEELREPKFREDGGAA